MDNQEIDIEQAWPEFNEEYNLEDEIIYLGCTIYEKSQEEIMVSLNEIIDEASFHHACQCTQRCVWDRDRGIIHDGDELYSLNGFSFCKNHDMLLDNFETVCNDGYVHQMHD